MTAVENPKPEIRKPKRSGVVVPHAPRFHQRIGALLVCWAVKLVAATLRYEWKDEAGLLTKPSSEPVIFCFWHNRLGLCTEAYRVYHRNSTKPGMAGLVSASRDGGFLAGILECFKVQPVRGSSSRRGPQALLELTTWAERGYDLAITPDGPRGPCYQVQEGVMALAQVTGLPIVPFGYHLQWKLRVKSWDRFQIPLPFSRCQMTFAKQIRVSGDASNEERERIRQQLETALKEISRD